MTSRFAYRLTLDPVLEPFRTEIEYAFDFVDECYGLVRSDEASRVVFYGPEAPADDHVLFCPAAIFPEGVCCTTDGIFPAEGRFREIEDGKGLSPLLPVASVSDRKMGYDAPGLIFHQLSRLEERLASSSDSYGRFPYDQTLAARVGRYGDPLADEAAEDLARAIKGETSPKSVTEYAVIPTHDVDKLRGYNYAHEPLRFALGDLIKRRAPMRAFKRLHRGYFAGMPWSSLAELMTLSEHYGVQSHFYFIGPSWAPEDTPYGYTMPSLLKRAVEAIRARGHVVGYHPGHDTFDNADRWRSQRDALEAIVGGALRQGRQHRLEYSFAHTPDIWADNGMTFDCTPAFPQATGFRTGTCRPHKAYSLPRRRSLPLTLLSTPIQDFAYFSNGKYRDMTIDDAVIEARKAIDVCRRYKGTVCILQHLGQVHDPARGFYRRVLAESFGAEVGA